MPSRSDASFPRVHGRSQLIAAAAFASVVALALYLGGTRGGGPAPSPSTAIARADVLPVASAAVFSPAPLATAATLASPAIFNPNPNSCPPACALEIPWPSASSIVTLGGGGSTGGNGGSTGGSGGTTDNTGPSGQTSGSVTSTAPAHVVIQAGIDVSGPISGGSTGGSGGSTGGSGGNTGGTGGSGGSNGGSGGSTGGSGGSAQVGGAVNDHGEPGTVVPVQTGLFTYAHSGTPSTNLPGLGGNDADPGPPPPPAAHVVPPVSPLDLGVGSGSPNGGSNQGSASGIVTAAVVGEAASYFGATGVATAVPSGPASKVTPLTNDLPGQGNGNVVIGSGSVSSTDNRVMIVNPGGACVTNATCQPTGR